MPGDSQYLVPLFCLAISSVPFIISIAVTILPGVWGLGNNGACKNYIWCTLDLGKGGRTNRSIREAPPNRILALFGHCPFGGGLTRMVWGTFFTIRTIQPFKKCPKKCFKVPIWGGSNCYLGNAQIEPE